MGSLTVDGFCILKNVISSEKVLAYRAQIKKSLHDLSTQLVGVSVADYINATGRWGNASAMTQTISKSLDHIIQKAIQVSLGLDVQHKKSNVICKTDALTDIVPFHQDISYNRDDPYHLSVWLALNDVYQSSGALQVIPRSHNGRIQPPVDFWSPYFVDSYNSNPNSLSLPISAGDAIVFDSKLWHGSGDNVDAQDRFVYVTRWVIPNQKFEYIPKPIPLTFGMFNCSMLTDEILRQALILLKCPYDISACDKEELIQMWLFFLRDVRSFSINNVDTMKAIDSLSMLLTLTQASQKHDAGDLSGKVHKSLWFSLLRHLNEEVKVV